MEDRKSTLAMVVPKDCETKIWRYMDIAQLIAMISTESLWFSSAARFDDPFEGSHSKRYIKLMQKITPDDVDKGKLIKFAKELPKYTFINCWHTCNTENYGMWKVYGKISHSIAIQSTYKRLCQCLKNYTEVVLGLVDYKDYDTGQLNPTGTIDLIPYFNKSVFFAYENELRAVIQHSQKLRNAIFSNELCNEQEQVCGLSKKVNIPLLIENVFVSPAAPAFYKDSVASILEKYGHCGLSDRVQYSALAREPMYGPSI